ncbi:MAG: hypothetical protein D6695_09945 [Planctomycetota bacterium]|nr:MAG: hypothetical protein D6695_09945 [Planctomycetota bacterium]
MALIRRADAEKMARDAIVLDLGRLEQQRDALVESAKSRAEAILTEARAERARILEGAAEQGRQAGFDEGKRAGLEQGREQGRAEAIEEFREKLDLLVRTWTEALEQFIDQRERMLDEARSDVVKLACEIASRATACVIETDPHLIERLMGEVLALISVPTRLRVRVSPVDEPTLREALPALLARIESEAEVELVVDDASPPGTCIAVTERQGVVDTSVQVKLDRIVGAILGESESEQ